jgi:hypothetical protein
MRPDREQGCVRPAIGYSWTSFRRVQELLALRHPGQFFRLNIELQIVQPAVQR